MKTTFWPGAIAILMLVSAVLLTAALAESEVSGKGKETMTEEKPAGKKDETGEAKKQTAEEEKPAAPVPEADAKAKEPSLSPGTYAVFETSLGNFTARLFTDRMPVTTQNFIDLAEGKKAYRDPKTGQMVKKPLYNGRKIFRISRGFMFQTGSANDTGAYNAGFMIRDEFHPSLRYSKPGLLAMANAGPPNTGSCQFFVTFSAEGCRHLQGKHPIFGEVVEGMDIVRKIESAKTVMTEGPPPEPTKPVDPPVIKKVAIKRVPEPSSP